MIILITGATHTGKTVLSQKLIEKYHFPCTSLDHLKMGLIRSGYTNLTPSDDDKMTDLLWPIVVEMIKTAIENKQNMILEGCYIPYDWEKYFTSEYEKEIRYICLIMSDEYIQSHFNDIKIYANKIEERLEDNYCTVEKLQEENRKYLIACNRNHCKYILIDSQYEIDLDLFKIGKEIEQ